MKLAALAILALIPQESPTTEDLIRKALDGDDDAVKALRAKGPSILRALADARLKAGETKGSGAVADLAFELKKAAAPEAAELLDKLGAIRVTVDFGNAPLADVLEYLREVSGLPLVTDDDHVTLDAAVSIKLTDVPLRRLLDAVGLAAGFEADARYGVWLLSAPERLWGAPKPERPAPLGEEEVAAAKRAIQQLGAESIEEREKAAAALAKLGRAAAPLLEEHAKSADKEVAARCRDLADRLNPKRVAGTLPAAAAWRSQKFDKDEDKAAAKKLATMKMDMSFDEAKLEDIAAFIRDFSGLNLLIERGVERTAKRFKVHDLTLGQALELLALPRGLDVKIDGGVIVIYEVKK